MDQMIVWGLFFIFLSAIIGAFLSARKRDRVLRTFDGFHVTVVLQDGRRVWGDLDVFTNGLFFKFKAPYRNRDGHLVDSFILYENEFPVVTAILRNQEGQTLPEQAQRFNEIHSETSFSLTFRMKRWFFLQMGILRDAFLKSFSFLLGQIKKTAIPGSRVGSLLSSHDQNITAIGGSVIGSVDMIHDPLLEHFYGKNCVVEIKEDKGWREIPGLLKEYSLDWIELLDAEWPWPVTMELAPGEAQQEAADSSCLLIREKSRIRWVNQSPYPVEMVKMEVDGMEVPLGVCKKRLASTEEYDLGVCPLGTLRCQILVMKATDLILPRSKATLRHGGLAERESIHPTFVASSEHQPHIQIHPNM